VACKRSIGDSFEETSGAIHQHKLVYCTLPHLHHLPLHNFSDLSCALHHKNEARMVTTSHTNIAITKILVGIQVIASQNKELGQ
jgi:hypothetical protein